MESPLRQIVENAGMESSVVANKIKESNDENYGCNLVDGSYGDMIEFGILDPTKVTRSALQYAASVAGLMITTECMITDNLKNDNKNFNDTQGSGINNNIGSPYMS